MAYPVLTLGFYRVVSYGVPNAGRVARLVDFLSEGDTPILVNGFIPKHMPIVVTN